MRQGVVDKRGAPGVIHHVSELLHDIIKPNMINCGNRRQPLLFEERIERWLGDYVRRPATDELNKPSGWRLQVAHNEELNTPLRELKRKGRVKVMRPGEDPQPGHSGKSVLRTAGQRGSGQRTSTHTRLFDNEDDEVPLTNEQAGWCGEPVAREGSPIPQPPPDDEDYSFSMPTSSASDAARPPSTSAEKKGSSRQPPVVDYFMPIGGRRSEQPAEAAQEAAASSLLAATKEKAGCANKQKKPHANAQQSTMQCDGPSTLQPSAKKKRPRAAVLPPDSSDEEIMPGNANGTMLNLQSTHTPIPSSYCVCVAHTAPTDKSKKQGGQPRIALKEVLKVDDLYLRPAVSPPLDEKNAVGRFVLIPREEFPESGQPEVGGWVGKILSVHKTTKLTTVQMMDTKKHWLLGYCQGNFKALS